MSRLTPSSFVLIDDSALNPAAIILSKQLPLFCAELQTLSRPRTPASDIFTLYEATGRLLDAWDELCPG